MVNYHTKNNEHVILLQFDQILDPLALVKYQLNFLITKKNDITKELREYDSDEIDLQREAFTELLRRLVKIDIFESRTLNFNMISDIKEKFFDLEQNSLVKVKEDFVD